MRLSFSKMHGLGNDFMVLDATQAPIALSPETIQRLSDRYRGIGFDQLLLIEPSRRADADYRYRIFNANGSEVEHCGNGARCVALFLYRQGLSDKAVIPLETARGLIVLKRFANDEVEVDMGEPDFRPSSLPLSVEHQAMDYTLEVNGQTLRFGAVSMGNPHAVVLCERLDDDTVQTLGPLIEQHPLFPQGVNVGFLVCVSSSVLQLRVFERNVGETQACGTGACAAMAVARLWGKAEAQARLQLQGGELSIHWQGEGHALLMRGPASHVFDGVVDIALQ